MPHQIKSPLTRAEQTHYLETSRHADVMSFIRALEDRHDPRLTVTRFGASPEGRELPLLILSSRGVKTPAEARATGLPIVLIINGIHAGEVEGKEASLMLVRDMLSGPRGELLEHVVLVIVPLFNPDGNDRIDPANRKLDITKLEGQLGPSSGVGTRVNASGINLNRDYMRQAALEMRLLSSQVTQVWQPHLTVDCHATNGSVHRFALTYDTPHTEASGRIEPIRFMREDFLPVVTQRLRGRTGLETFFYGNFVEDEGGKGEGWMTYTHHPRFGSNYRGLTNRLDLLAETYAYLTFPERVFTTYEFLREVLTLAGERGDDIIQVVESSQTPPDRIAVRSRLETVPEPAVILTREPRKLDGHPISVTIPHYARFTGTEIVDRPWGYVVPEGMAERLEGHGLKVRTLEREITAEIEVARVEGATSDKARQILEASGAEKSYAAEYRREARRLPAGTRFLEASQPLGAIAVYLCEAKSDDGAVHNGMVAEPAPGEELPIYRVLEPLT